MSTTLTGTTCSDAYTQTNTLISENIDTGSEYKGQYSVYQEADDTDPWIYSKRLTYNKKYTDDQLFEYTPTGDNGSDCQVVAKSRSESLSYLDNGVNFCNMWNLLSRV